MADPLAQQVEHNTFNVGVLGSSPKRITERIKQLPIFGSCFFYGNNIAVTPPSLRDTSPCQGEEL